MFTSGLLPLGADGKGLTADRFIAYIRIVRCQIFFSINPIPNCILRRLALTGCSLIRLWCYRNGLDTGLDKTAAQRQAEIDLLQREVEQRDPDVSPRHNAHRAKFIARIFKGELQDETVSDLLFRIRAIYNNLDGDPDAQRALGRLVLHVEKYGDLMRPARACKRFGHTVVNTYIAALEQLARNHTDWIRPVEDWRPNSYKTSAPIL